MNGTDHLHPALDVEELQLAEARLPEFIAAWQTLTDAPLVIYTSASRWYSIAGRDAAWPQDQEDAPEARRKDFLVRRIVTFTRSYVLGIAVSSTQRTDSRLMVG